MAKTMSDSTTSSSTLGKGASATGLSCWVAAERWACTAPGSRGTGTAVPFAGHVQVAGARNTDLPGLPPRGAPV